MLAIATIWSACTAEAAFLWSKLDAGSVSTLIAALTAILAAYGAARLTIRAAREERLAAKRENDLGTAFNAAAKIVRIFSYMRAIHGNVADALARLEERGFNKQRPWESLQPFATLPAEITFGSEETAFLLSTGVNALMLRTLELTEVYNDLLQMLRLYSEKRIAFMSALTPVVVDGRIDIAPMDQETALKLAHLTVPLQTLFAALVNRVDVDYAQATDVLNLLLEHCYARFGRDFPRMEIIGMPGATTAPTA